MTYNLTDILTVYILALLVIPATIAAYSLSYVINAKDEDKMVKESHMMMRFCVKMAGPYFALVTMAFIAMLPFAFQG